MAGVDLVLREELVAFGDSASNSGFRLTLCATNDASSSTAVTMGVRWNIDHQLGPDDGPVFATVQCDPFALGPAITSEMEIPPTDIQDYFRTEGNGSAPVFDVSWATAPVSGIPDTGTPDRLVWRHYDPVFLPWDYVPLTGTDADTDATSLYYFGSSIADGINIGPGESFCRSVVAFTELPCGSGGCVSAPDPLALPNTLRATSDAAAGAAVLSWMSSDPNTVAYRIRRDITKAPPYALHPSAGDLTVTSFADAVLRDGSSYYYQITGLNCLGVEGP